MKQAHRFSFHAVRYAAAAALSLALLILAGCETLNGDCGCTRPTARAQSSGTDSKPRPYLIYTP